MLKQHGAFVLTFLLLIPCLVTVFPLGDLSPIGIVKAPSPTPSEDTVTYWDGDWWVDSDMIYTNQTVIVNGNLTVMNGFSLTLINVTIRMNGTGNLSRHIEVNSTAGLVIQDYDNNPLTMDDGCNITSNHTDSMHRFGFWVNPNSLLSIENSFISEVGHDVIFDRDKGLYVQTTDALIRNTTISQSYSGIVVFEGSGTIIENCTLQNLGEDGINIEDSSDMLIVKNTIFIEENNGFGIYITGNSGRNRVASNSINNSAVGSEGIRIAGSGKWNEIVQNKINTTGSDGIRIFASYTNITSNTVLCWSSGDGIQLDFGSFIRIFDNVIIASGINARGLNIAVVDNITIKGGSITVNQNNCRGISLEFSTHDIIIDNVNITINSGVFNYGIYSNQAYDIMIVNSTINGVGTHMGLGGDSHVIALNTTFSSYDISDALSELTVQHFLNINVIDYQGNPMPGALVQIRNITKFVVFNGPTGAGGIIQFLPLTEVVHYQSASIPHTPHNISATAIGYDPCYKEPVMNQERNITAVLLPKGVTKAVKKGDWWIDTTEEYWNTSFLVDGNITINFTGRLLLHNCTIMMNATLFNSQYHIDITAGGEMHVFDIDWDNTTTDDASVITDSPFDVDDGSNLDYVFAFHAYEWSVLEIRNSHIFDCGWDAPAFEDKGIYVETDFALFDHVNIHGRFIGINFLDSANSVVENCSFNISGFSDFSIAIRAWNCPNLMIMNNIMSIYVTNNDDIGVYVGDSQGAVIQGNHVNMYGTQGYNYAIFLSESSDYIVSYNNVSLYAPGIGLNFWEMDRCYGIGNNIVSYVNNYIAMYIYNLTDSIIDESTIDLNGWGCGVYLEGWLTNTVINNLAITGNVNFIDGIFLGGAHWAKLTNVIIDLNGLGSYGFTAVNSDNITVSDLTMNVIGLWGGAMILNRTINCWVDSAQITTNGFIPALMGLNCSNIWIVNSTLSAATTFDVDVEQNALVILINVTFTDTDVTDPFTRLIVLWYLQVRVEDIYGQPFPGVNVRVEEAYGSEVRTGVVNSNGWMNWTACLGYVLTASGMNNASNPYNLSAFNATCWDNTSIDLTNGGAVVTITLANDDPVITDPIANVQVQEDSTYTRTFNATDKEGNPLAWSINASLSWITINAIDGNLTISPTDDDVGINVFTIRVTDINGGSDEFSVTIDVTNRDPVIQTTDVLVAIEDALYSVDYSSDDDPSSNWTLLIGPGWLAIDNITGVLSGTPNNTQVGPAVVNISVEDYHGGITWREFIITVGNTQPLITTSNVITTTEDSLYQVDYASNDDSQGTVTWSLSTNAGWLSINTTTGVLSGTPINTQVGEWTVNVTVDDGNGGITFSNFTLTVINAPPIIPTANVLAAVEDALYSVDYDSDDDPSTNWTLLIGPSWLNIDKTTGVLSGTPNNTHVGPALVNMSVEDYHGGITWREFTITVGNTQPLITTSDVITATEDSLYQVDYASTDDFQGAVTWSLSTDALWLSINQITGVISATPLNTQVGNWTVNVSVDDGNGGIAFTNFTLTVNNAPPIIPTANVLAAVEDALYSVDYDSDDDPSTNWTLLMGPSWLNIDNTTGVLSGIPNNTHVGPAIVNISVEDYHGGITWREFTITVGNTQPLITTSDVITATEDSLYQVDYASNDDSQGTVTWSLSTNAGWLSINTITGVLSGTPINTQVGDWTVNVTVDDGNGGIAFSNFTLTVINAPPVILTQDIIWADEDITYSANYASSDDGQGAIAWSLATNASWLTINTTTGVISGIPRNEHVGSNWVNVSVDDGNGGLGWHNFSLTVNNSNDAPVISTQDILSAIEDQLYAVDYKADDDDDDTLTWSIDTTAEWLSIDPTFGEITGIPTNSDAGSWDVTVICDDGYSGTDSHSFTVNVASVNDAPIITYYLPMNMYPTVEEGMSLDFNITYDDEDSDTFNIVWTLGSQVVRNDVPFWSYEPDFGTAGDHEIIVNVTDFEGASTEQRWIVIVTQANRPPIIEVFEPTNTKPVMKQDESSMTFSVNATDLDDDQLTYQWFINGDDTGERTSSFTMDRSAHGPGTYNLSVQVTDENGTTAIKSWSIEVAPPKKEETGSINLFLILAVVIAVIVAMAFVLILKKGQTVIEDIFVVANSGLLMAHRSKEIRPDMDDDILGSMLTAVQDFVKDSFKEKSKYGLKRLDFGDSLIHITQGKYFYIAVILSGKEPTDFEKSLENVVSKIESKYEPVLKEWDGDMGELRGMKDMLDELLK